MTKDEVCARIREIGIVPAIRVSSYDDAHFATEAVDKRRYTDRGNYHDRSAELSNSFHTSFASTTTSLWAPALFSISKWRANARTPAPVS